MLYFIKRNHRLQEYKDYYKELQTLCVCLDKLTPELQKAKVILSKKSPSGKSLGKFLEESILGITKAKYIEEITAAFESGKLFYEQAVEFKEEEFVSLDLKVRYSFTVLKNYVASFKTVLDKLKNYESFQGRIKFGQFANLFNFEDYIYEDKQFQYSIISNYNKRIIPEFISASFANMVYENFVGDEIRRNMEQYFIAIMSNMDYQNFAHVGQVKQELNGILSKEKNLIYIIGAAPHTFSDEEYVEIVNERIDKANDLLGDGLEFNSKNPLWKKDLEGQLSSKLKPSSLYFTTGKNSVLGDTKIDGDKKTSKLTSENLDYIYTDIKSKKLNSYNLFIVTSTFHILKTAIEIERHFYNNNNHKPDNIIFIGNEKFFELAHNKSNCQDTERAPYHKKKIKSFLYELFMHTLDKNATK